MEPICVTCPDCGRRFDATTEQKKEPDAAQIDLRLEQIRSSSPEVATSEDDGN